MNRGKKGPTSPILEALRVAQGDEHAAAAFLEKHRWGAMPVCPRCGSVNVYAMVDAKTGERNRDHRWRCRDCRRMYTVRTGTVLEETRLPLRVWCYALWSAVSSKKGVSALQISRECEISYKSALFLMHRLRAGMADLSPDRKKLSGIVEIDETYVGGKPRVRGTGNATRTKRHAPVVGMVERKGPVRFFALDRVDGDALRPALERHIASWSTVMTDESGLYRNARHQFGGGHYSVKHSEHEYVRDGWIHSNTIEGAFSLLKRGIYGTFHSVSRKHLHRYCAEFEFRYNARDVDDGERAAKLVKGTEGKRLTYKQQVAG